MADMEATPQPVPVADIEVGVDDVMADLEVEVELFVDTLSMSRYRSESISKLTSGPPSKETDTYAQRSRIHFCSSLFARLL